MTPIHPLANIQVQHEYFNKQKPSYLQILPTPACQQLMNRYGLRIRETVEGIEFYLIHTDLNAIENLPTDRTFTFSISTEDQVFFNYTDLDWDGNSHLVFSNMEEASETQNEDYSTLPYGIYIELDLNPSINQLPIEFQLSLNARSVLWEYNIIGKDIEKIHIESTNTDLAFMDPVEVNLPNGQLAQQLISKAVHKLQEKYPFQLNLIFDGTTINLPFPSPNNLSKHPESGQLIVSSYIYL